MRVEGKLYDGATGETIEGASITIVGSDSKPLGGGTLSGKDGKYYISSALLDDPYNKLLFTHVDYADKLLRPGSAQGEVEMNVEADMLESAIITYKIIKKKAVEHVKKNKWVYWVLGATIAGGIGILIYRNRK